MKTLVVQLEDKKVTIELCDAKHSVASDTWLDNNDMLEQFFPRLDHMLKSNGLSIEKIDDFVLTMENPTGYTTRRIVQTIIATLRFAHKMGKSAQSVDK